jgi:hypothetical protein
VISTNIESAAKNVQPVGPELQSPMLLGYGFLFIAIILLLIYPSVTKRDPSGRLNPRSPQVGRESLIGRSWPLQRRSAGMRLTVGPDMSPHRRRIVKPRLWMWAWLAGWSARPQYGRLRGDKCWVHSVAHRMARLPRARARAGHEQSR